MVLNLRQNYARGGILKIFSGLRLPITYRKYIHMSERKYSYERTEIQL